MGFHYGYLKHLHELGCLKNGESRILDIGSQNILDLRVEDVLEFAGWYGRTDLSKEHLTKESERIAYFSVVRPGERTTYLSELLDLTTLFYTSFDVCPALKTEIFDLNVDDLPASYSEYFDVVLNFGTTEHLLNQLHAFRVMHEALKVGGVICHNLPSFGYVNHGYVNYNPLMLRDIAKANSYEIMDFWYCQGSGGPALEPEADLRPPGAPYDKNGFKVSQALAEHIAYYNLNFLARKTTSASFRMSLELRTSHSQVDSGVEEKYKVDLATVRGIDSEARDDASAPQSGKAPISWMGSIPFIRRFYK